MNEKLIWMAHTIGLLAQISPEKAEELIKSGEIKEVEDKGKYLLILGE